MAFHEITTEPAGAHVRVEVDGQVVAESDDAIVLREGSLPPRYYLPPEDVRADLLRPSDTHTHCPFKGDASYHSLGGHEDLVWFYPEPKEGVEAIRGRLAFWNEKVDLHVGG